MNTLAKPLAIGATVLYVIGVLITAWYLIALPEYLMKHSSAIDLEAISQIKPLHNKFMLLVGATLVLGLFAVILQIVASKNQEANVVYVEKMKDSQQTTARLDDEDLESHDVSAMSEELLGAIRQAAAAPETADKKLELALRAVCKQLQASQGAVYINIEEQERQLLELRAGFALMKPDSKRIRYEMGEGLPGQVAKEGLLVNLNKVPDGYIKVLSGLGSASPKHLLLVPVKVAEKIAGVVEIASFTPLLKKHEELVKQSFEIMAKIIDESSLQPSIMAPEEDLINEPVKR